MILVTILLTFLFNFCNSEKTYLILGGSGASNSNNFNFNISNENILSYNFKKLDWEVAGNPMIGANGNKFSTWSYLGNKLYEFYQDDIYFIDCARENATVFDWSKSGKYYNLGLECIRFGNNFSDSLNILWQDEPNDSIYSYDNTFRNTLKDLDIYHNNWFLSVFTYPKGYKLRWDKLNDILYLVNKYKKFYVGANLDGECLGSLPFNNDDTRYMGDLWFSAILNKEKVKMLSVLFTDCSLWNGIFEIIFSLCISIILIYCFLGCINYYKFGKTKKKYNQLLIS